MSKICTETEQVRRKEESCPRSRVHEEAIGCLEWPAQLSSVCPASLLTNAGLFGHQEIVTSPAAHPNTTAGTVIVTLNKKTPFLKKTLSHNGLLTGI